MNAEVLKIEGNTEKELAAVLASRRQYEYLNSKLDALAAMGNNPNLKIFGNSQDNVLSQMAAYNINNAMQNKNNGGDGPIG
jgi:hypothetical protein